MKMIDYKHKKLEALLKNKDKIRLTKIPSKKLATSVRFDAGLVFISDNTDENVTIELALNTSREEAINFKVYGNNPYINFLYICYPIYNGIWYFIAIPAISMKDTLRATDEFENVFSDYKEAVLYCTDKEYEYSVNRNEKGSES